MDFLISRFVSSAKTLNAACMSPILSGVTAPVQVSSSPSAPRKASLTVAADFAGRWLGNVEEFGQYDFSGLAVRDGQKGRTAGETLP